MTQAKPTILVIDDDMRLRSLLEDYLTKEGFLVNAAENTSKAKSLLKTQKYDALVLDVMMPHEDGLSFLKWMRFQEHAYNGTPVLLLTALGEPTNRIDGLESGANDYLVKPFEPRELVLRLKNIIKGSYLNEGKIRYISFGEFVYDFQEKNLTKGDNLIHLTSGEQKLLDLLLANAGNAISRQHLANYLGLSLSPRTIDVQVTRLRKKIEIDAKKPIFLCTMRHEGYVMRSTEIKKI